MKRIIFAMLLVFTVSAFVGCNSCSNKGDVDEGEQLMELPVYTHEDSTRVLSMTEDFMKAVHNGDMKYAFDLLSDVKGDTAIALTPERRMELSRQFERMPVKEYFFIDLEFVSKEYAMVSYRCRFMDAPEDNPDYPVFTTLKLRVQLLHGRDILSLHHEEYLTR